MTTIDAFPEATVDPGVDPDRRYTTRETMALCMRLAGVDAWDLDVAADEESHWAPKYFTQADDGLKQPWAAERVWCNPPYSDIAPWIRKANYEAHTRALIVAMLLPANRTDQPWWQDHVEVVRDRPKMTLGADRTSACAHYGMLRAHFLPTRIRFGHPGNKEAVGVGSPPFGCVLLVWRRR